MSDSSSRACGWITLPYDFPPVIVAGKPQVWYHMDRQTPGTAVPASVLSRTGWHQIAGQIRPTESPQPTHFHCVGALIVWTDAALRGGFLRLVLVVPLAGKDSEVAVFVSIVYKTVSMVYATAPAGAIF